ncbi:response regulator [Thalassococcus profundi]|uniref:Response regulator n=1 Tax=Thalassococcus profundi TaxID=2282382 RepID=A0A369TMJ5_9RHOB|nr:response regulator [Thalassococcus profundi]RDD65904.1 response regulator [Thalassococcus profundi]
MAGKLAPMKILIIDDDPIAIDLLRDCLSEAGYTDLTCVTSADAGELHIRNKLEHFDCFLLDISMPGKSGIEICAEIRKTTRYRYTPILMITRLAERSSIRAAFQNGASDYITKPFEYFEVIARINIAQRLAATRAKEHGDPLVIDPMPKAGSSEQYPGSFLRKIDTLIDQESLSLERDGVLPMFVFKNYLERITRVETCAIEVFAIKVEDIEDHFGRIDPANFIRFIGALNTSVKEFTGIDSAFMTHVGEGLFLCAADGANVSSVDKIERGVSECFDRRLSKAVPGYTRRVELTSSEPLHLLTASRPNFNRLIKVMRTRVNLRQSDKMSSVGA